LKLTRLIATNRGFRRGAIATLPVLLVIAPFGAIFGAIATQAGLNLYEAVAMSVIVLAGAAQIASLQLLNEQAPAIIAILTGIFINLRFAMYSASLAPYWRGAPLWQRALGAYLMVDQAYGMSVRRYIEFTEDSLTDRMGYYFGVALPTVSVWFASTAAGAILGAAIPPQLSLDFAIPVTFIAIFAPMLRGIPNLAAAATSVVLALGFHALPYNLGLILAAFGGMGVGSLVENRFQPRSSGSA